MVERHVIDQLPDYVLDCLHGGEKLQVESHLETCEKCRAEFLDYQDLINDLPLGMKIVEPDPQLKDRIMKPIKAGNNVSNSAVRPAFLQRVNQNILGSFPVWGFASLALILILAISNLVMWQQMKELKTSGDSQLAAITMAGTELTPNATGLLVISRDGEYGTLVVDGLPDLGKNQQYQLWLIRDGDRSSGGVFSVSPEGYGNLRVSAPMPLVNYTAFGITIEPVGGSSGPTGEKVLGGTFF